MYRVFIVDDDDMERRGLRTLALFPKLEMEIVGEAWNGQAALEQLKERPADIVIADVRMPVMDGLSFANALRQTAPGVKLVMMSGYEDFDAVRRSLTADAEAFLTKPIRLDELKSTLIRVMDRIDTERNRTLRQETMSRYVERALPIVRDQLLRDMMLGIQSAEEPRTRREAEAIGLFQDVERYCVFAVQAESAGILEILQRLESRYDAVPVAIHGGLYALMVTIPALADDEALFDLLQERASEILARLQGACGSATVGISGLGADPSQMARLYAQACTALQKRAVYRQNRVYWYDMQQAAPTLPDMVAFAQRVERALMRNDAKAVDALIDGLYDALWRAGAPSETAQTLSLEMLFHFVVLAHQDGKDCLGLFSGRQIPYQSIAGLTDPVQMKGWMKELFRRILATLYLRPRTQTEEMVGRALETIERHYREDISADTLARQLFVSPSHLRRVFKNLTGQTIQECLLAARMRRARELLLSPGAKVFDTAQAVGYENFSYFCIVFKKYYGVTPGEYRNANP